MRGAQSDLTREEFAECTAVTRRDMFGGGGSDPNDKTRYSVTDILRIQFAAYMLALLSALLALPALVLISVRTSFDRATPVGVPPPAVELDAGCVRARR